MQYIKNSVMFVMNFDCVRDKYVLHKQRYNIVITDYGNQNIDLVTVILY